jgi:hypothetical protein
MRWARGEIFHPFEFRFFEGGDFPSTLTCDGLTAYLKPSFRVWLRYDQLIQAKGITDEERFATALNLCVERLDAGFPMDILGLGLVRFYERDLLDQSAIFEHPSKQNHKALYEKRLKKAAQKGPGLSLFWDTHEIWSGFASFHKIDLFEVDMHWWKFLGYLGELPQESKLMGLAKLRTTDVQQEVDKKDKDDFLISQYLVSLPTGGILDGKGKK